MYIAEIKGKLSSKLQRSEDILTSNVFSFFKYASREVFLSQLIDYLNISVTHQELVKAQFIFWPKYDDRTEPDLVLVIGKYYLLFEAKYFSGFGKENSIAKAQFVREIEGGLNEAKSLGQEFMAIAITAHYHFPQDILDKVPKKHRTYFRWMNWQSVASILLDLLECHQEKLADFHFASDLYELLDDKKLRGFLSFERLTGTYKSSPSDMIFFSAQSSDFRDKFMGFKKVLSNLTDIKNISSSFFYKKLFFSKMPKLAPIEFVNIFYRR